jgi:hypothetical protein
MTDWARDAALADAAAPAIPRSPGLVRLDLAKAGSRALDWLGLAMLIGGLLAALVPLLGEPLREDWLTYVRGSELVFSGQSPYAAFQLEGPYPLGTAANGNGFVYPPSAAVVMAPFLHPFELWATLGIVLFAGGLLAIARHHGLSLLVPGTAMLLSSAVLWSGTISGAASPAIAGLLGLAYVGVPTAGIAAAVKLFPASWVILGWSRWIAIGAAVPILVSVALAGFGPWLEYPTAFRNAEPACWQFSSLACVGVPEWMTFVLGALLVAGAMRASRAWRLLALGMLPLVIADQIPMHYYALVVPGCVALMARAAELSPWRRPATTPQEGPEGTKPRRDR